MEYLIHLALGSGLCVAMALFARCACVCVGTPMFELPSKECGPSSL